MSHNVRLNNVKFSNLAILRSAVEELRAEGVNVELVEGTDLVARIADTQGRRGYETAHDVKCDVMLRCPDYVYDVAFHRNEAGDYIPETEAVFRQPGLTGDYAASPVEGCTQDFGGIQIGQLSQRYALISAEMNAAMAGMSSTRSYDQVKRQYVLDVEVN